MTLRTRLTCAIFIPALFAMMFAACGGDDDDKSSSGDDSGAKISTSTGSDEKFVADICSAFKTFSDDFTKNSADTSKIKTEEDAVKLFYEPFDKLAKSFAKANPPKDLKEWHTDASKQLTAAAASMKKGDMSALDSFDTLAEPPQAASDRLSKVAEKNKDCQAADFSFNQ
jgi:hypothetical protein